MDRRAIMRLIKQDDCCDITNACFLTDEVKKKFIQSIRILSPIKLKKKYEFNDDKVYLTIKELISPSHPFHIIFSYDHINNILTANNEVKFTDRSICLVKKYITIVMFDSYMGIDLEGIDMVMKNFDTILDIEPFSIDIEVVYNY